MWGVGGGGREERGGCNRFIYSEAVGVGWRREGRRCPTISLM